MSVGHAALTSPCERALGAGLGGLLQGRGQHTSRESASKETVTPLTPTSNCKNKQLQSLQLHGKSQPLKGKQKTPPHSVENHKKVWQGYQSSKEGLNMPRPSTVLCPSALDDTVEAGL